MFTPKISTRRDPQLTASTQTLILSSTFQTEVQLEAVQAMKEGLCLPTTLLTPKTILQHDAIKVSWLLLASLHHPGALPLPLCERWPPHCSPQRQEGSSRTTPLQLHSSLYDKRRMGWLIFCLHELKCLFSLHPKLSPEHASVPQTPHLSLQASIPSSRGSS